jgi:predicted HTH transcriptional regulator
MTVLIKVYLFLLIHSHAYTEVQFCVLYTSTLPNHDWEIMYEKLSNAMLHRSCKVF